MDCSVGQNGTGRDTLSSFKKSSFYGKYLGQNETKMNKREKKMLKEQCFFSSSVLSKTFVIFLTKVFRPMI